MWVSCSDTRMILISLADSKGKKTQVIIIAGMVDCWFRVNRVVNN